MLKFPKAALKKYHKLGDLKQHKSNLSQFWEARSLKSRSLKSRKLGHASSEDSWKEFSPNSSRFWWWLVIVGILWLAAASLQRLPPSSLGVLLV